MRRLWTLAVAAVLAILFGFLGRGTDVEAFNVLSGLAWLVVIVTGVAMLPFWSRILPPVEPMPGLFQRPAAGERWCTGCGNPAGDGAPCGVCGEAPKPPRAKAAKAEAGKD